MSQLALSLVRPTHMPLRPSPIGFLHDWPVGRSIFDALCDHPYGLSTQELIPHCYSVRHEPDYAVTSIHCIIMRMNRRFAENRSCFRIRANGGPGSKYRIFIVQP